MSRCLYSPNCRQGGFPETPDSPGPLGIGPVFSKYALDFPLHVPSRQLVEHPRDQQIDNEILLGHEAILSAMYLEHPLHVEEQ